MNMELRKGDLEFKKTFILDNLMSIDPAAKLLNSFKRTSDKMNIHSIYNLKRFTSKRGTLLVKI